MVTNSTADLIKEIYSDYTINKINVARSINSSVAKRGKIEELVITNYVPNVGAYIENLRLKSNA
jgi:site-specific DNA-adenine methylase